MTKNILNNLQELQDLSVKWSDMSQKFNGWECKEYVYSGFEVWCYFSDESDHKSVNFNFGTHCKQIAFAFHTPIKIEISIDQIKNLKKYISIAHKYLEHQTSVFENRDGHAIESEKLKKILAAKKTLIELGTMSEEELIR